MTSRFQGIEELCQQELEKPEGERLAFLEGACAGDGDLRGEAIEITRVRCAPGVLGIGW